MNRFLSEQEEREIEAIFQQNRTPFESQEDRRGRLWHELQRKEKAWTKHVQLNEKLDRWSNRLLCLSISILVICATWSVLAVFFWGGSLYPE